uniref:Poly [ADP-ribose] polymerase n=1 Tax=Heterorhabditis bacteriophora TaxID=37862 RepID=A0A1I7XLR1_HETBA
MENTESVERRCDLPYGVEYAKSARAACKGCKNNIGQKQAELMWELRTGFQNNMKKKQMIELLEKNDQQPPSEESKILDLLVDCALFGKPAPCCKCPHGQIVFSTSNKTYVCLGYMSEYTKCMYQDKNPLRSPFAIPRDMIEAIDWLKTIKVNLLTTRVYNVDDDEKIVEPSDSFKYLGSRIFKSVAEEYDGDGVKSTGISSGKSRQIIKNGTVVDQECEYAEVSHVHRAADGTLYSAMLGSTDMAQNRNSYYKMQLLAHDTKRLQFFEKTGNKWENRKYFRKKAGLMGMVETDYSEFENVGTEVVTPGSKSKLHRAIKEIIMMIFDVENMKSAMQGFELDLDRMPLGKLSKKQIMSAYKVLTKLQTILADEKPDPDKVLDASNSFYTLIPHNSGMKPPELLNNSKILKEKTAMLDSLLEIQFAYEVLQEDKNSISVDGRDPVDVHYEKLGCDMQYIEPTSSEYEYIMLYMKNTHGATHNMFKLDVVDVIRLRRKGESEKFRGNLGNRHLLWHGSGNSNYAGILSQGLRIAPPEAPVTGYMFGKGLYFADMVSKSANYCRIQRFDTDGLLMLCDVALGKIQEEKHATMRNNLKKGFSSVKGDVIDGSVGMTIPDPNQTIKSEDGYFIPLGTPITVSDGGKHGVDYSLLYNE